MPVRTVPSRQPASPGRHPAVVAAAWMCGTLGSFMAMAVGGRELSYELGTFEILFFRSLVGLLIVCLLLTRSGWHGGRTQLLGVHAIRNLGHFGGQYGWFYGIALIPLAEVFALEFTLPIWTAILATLLLGERLNRSRLLAVALGAVGMLIMLRPGFAVVEPAALVVLAAAFCYGLSHTLTRKLALTEAPLTILFYMTVVQLPLGLLPALEHWVWPSPTSVPWLIVVGIAGLTGHYCLARALSLADAAIVIPIDFLRLPLIAVVGYLYYREPLDIYVLIGAAVMFAGNLINVRAEQRRAPQPR